MTCRPRKVTSATGTVPWGPREGGGNTRERGRKNGGNGERFLKEDVAQKRKYSPIHFSCICIYNYYIWKRDQKKEDEDRYGIPIVFFSHLKISISLK